MNYEVVKLDWAGGVASLGKELDGVGKSVLDGHIVILKEVFTEELMDRCKATLLDWQASNLATNPDRLKAGESWWRRDVNPPSKTPHLFETFCLVFSDDNSKEFGELKSVFGTMEELWEALLASFSLGNPVAEGQSLRPQAIHYPRGGGFFDWHVHDLAPQGIGLIVGLSKQGRDFATGGTLFRDCEGELDTSDLHDIGDVCLFRYDLEHAVGTVDPSRDLEWGATGRWTLVLPVM